MSTARHHTYDVHGMTVRLPFPCTGFSEIGNELAAEVSVIEGRVPRSLPTPIASERGWDAEPGRFLFRGGRRSGRFLVEAGQITLERNPEADEDRLADHFVGLVLVALLRQRGALVLHANAVLTPEGVKVIAGASGAGKSTTTAGLLARGCTMLADDITVLRNAPDGRIGVWPGPAQIRLTPASAAYLSWDHAVDPSQRPWSGPKLSLPTAASAAGVPGWLNSVDVLDRHRGDGVVRRRLRGAEKFDALHGCLHGPITPDEHDAIFPLSAEVVGRAEVYRLSRPEGVWSVEELCDVLLGEPA